MTGLVKAKTVVKCSLKLYSELNSKSFNLY